MIIRPGFAFARPALPVPLGRRLTPEHPRKNKMSHVMTVPLPMENCDWRENR